MTPNSTDILLRPKIFMKKHKTITVLELEVYIDDKKTTIQHEDADPAVCYAKVLDKLNEFLVLAIENGLKTGKTPAGNTGNFNDLMAQGVKTSFIFG